MIRKFSWIALLLLAFSSVSALDVQSRNFGLGIFLGGGITHGGVAGVHGKYWETSTEAWDGAVTWGSGDRWGSINLQADRLWHFFDLIQLADDVGRVPLYAGFGGWFGAYADDYWKGGKLEKETDIEFGIRIPGGFSFLAKTAPLDAFLEIAPGLALWPSAVFTLDLMLGAHFYF